MDSIIPARRTCLFGQQGTNTAKPPKSTLAQTVKMPDGFSAVAPGHMYRPEEAHTGRREPQFPGLHNLHESVIARTLAPLPLISDDQNRRATLWDSTAVAVREAMQNIPSGSHVVVCANSGPKNDSIENLHPSHSTPGAFCGLLLVAEFRPLEDIHPRWHQIAVPIMPTEGRLLAGLRLLPTVTGRSDLTFTITNLTNPTVRLQDVNLFHPGLLYSDEYDTIKNSFAWDGDLYGWDEAVLYTRMPIVVIADIKPERRFDYWGEGTVYYDVTWLKLDDGQLCGGYRARTTRKDVIEWDEHGIPGGLLTKNKLLAYCQETK